MSRTLLVRALGAAALAAAVGLIGTTPAFGHASQTGSSPEAGAVLDTAPSSVEVTFDTPLMDVGAALVVRSEGGTVISDSTPEVDRTRIRVAVPTTAAPGMYTVAFRVVSQDGHPITSTFDYTVAGDVPSPAAPAASVSPAPSAEAAAAPGEASEGPPVVLIVGGLLALTLLGVGAIALRR
jgi:hypothetical protein